MRGKTARLSELARLVQGECSGGDVEITGLGDLASSGPGEIAFISESVKDVDYAGINAAALIVPKSTPCCDLPVIRVGNPVLAAALIHQHFCHEEFVGGGIAPGTHIGADCSISPEVTIGPGVVIGRRCRIGSQVTIHPGTVLGDEVVIGDGTTLYPNVSVLDRSELGRKVVVHSGTVIGSDGFGYVPDARGRQIKRPQVGYVRIDDEVEIGANVCVDRATFGCTWIKRGTKIDNQVQIAHNVTVGEDCILVAQAGVSGSTELGDMVVLAGKAAVAGHLRIGSRVVIAGKAGVTSSQEDGAVVSGFPAIPHQSWRRAALSFRKIPELLKDVRSLKKDVAKLIKKMMESDNNGE